MEYFSKTINDSFENAREVTAAHGRIWSTNRNRFKATLKKTGCRFYNYTILGPAMASAQSATGRR
jgi:hypothetical protein